MCALSGTAISGCAVAVATGLAWGKYIAVAPSGTTLFFTHGVGIYSCAVSGATVSGCAVQATNTGAGWGAAAGLAVDAATNKLYASAVDANNGMDAYIVACE